MAQKRMFSLNVVDTDRFLEMPVSARLLYYELGMRADDDGFVDNWKKILTFTGLKEDDMKVLISKSFVIPFDSGIIVIRHWRLNNYLQKDRIKPTIHQEEFKILGLDENNVYTLDTNCIHSIDKNSIDKNNILIYEQKDSKFEQEFEQLWSKYPNKKGKKDALKHYIAVRKKNVDFETINKGLDNYIEYLKHNPSKANYIKYGSSWFNQECWNDIYGKEETMDKLDVKLEQLEKWIEED